MTTATKAARTPGPWHVEHDPRWMWANVQRADKTKPDIAKGISPDDAAFIVTACNAYDADQQRIAELEAALRQIQETATTMLGRDQTARDIILDAARAALAKGQA